LQERLRLRAIQAVESGFTQQEAADRFSVSRVAVNQWVRRWREGGEKALQARRRGRPPETRLNAQQTAATIRLIVGRCPDQLHLPFALWTREAVQQLLEKKFGAELSVWTVGRYLKRWGLTPQKPLHRAFEQDPEAVRRWLQEEYPAIRRRAKREGAEIHWADETGLRSDHHVGRSYGLRGRTPVIPGTGQRFGCNMISTITNRGRLSFMVFRGTFTVRTQVKFLQRLLRQVKTKVFWIVDRHPVHKAAAVSQWLEKHRDRIERIFLPAYSPELNPDELLNQDVKSNALGRRRPQDSDELMANLRAYLRSTQRQPEVVCSYFAEKTVRYAAA
jgi:transposase